MNTRAGDIGIFILERSRRGSMRRLLIALMIVTGLILYVGEKVTIISLGYQIESLQREKQELERTNRSLRIEASSLASTARIEEIATKRLGMIRPSKENIVIVRRKEDGKNSKSRVPNHK